jgi:predicted NAD/FAD-binding protein
MFLDADEALTAQGPSLSLDAASMTVVNAEQKSEDRVDLPMRAFAGGFYNNLKALYDHLKVPYHSQPFLFEFAKASKFPATNETSYFVHASNLHQLAPRPSAVGAIQYLLEVFYLIACYGWFSLCCLFIAPHAGETLRQYLGRTWTPQRFVTYYLLPLMSSVTTCPHEALLNFPASDLTEYKRRTHRAPHYTVSEGVKSAQDLLIKGIDYELNAAVKAVEPQEEGVNIWWEQAGSGMCMERFDVVVLAVAPDVVGHVFKPLQHHMARMPTTVVESVVHTDRSVLKETTAIRRAVKGHDAQHIYLRTSSDSDTKTESHHVQSCGAIVTTCPYSPLDPSLVMHSAKFTRVLRSPESQRIVNAIFGEGLQSYEDDKSVPRWRSGEGNVWLAGGWCWDGMVLLEGCVVSAMRIARDLGVEVPWQQARRKQVEL